MAKYILTVTLNPALDRTVTVDSLINGKDIATKVDWVIAGGKGINVARVLTRLRHKVLATGLLGGSSGRYIENFLKGESIPASFMQICADTRVHTTIRERSTGRITRLLEPGSCVTEKEFELFKRHYEKLLKNASYIVFSGSLPPGVDSSAYCELISMAHAKSIECALDTSGSALRLGIKASPDIIKPNYEELIALLGGKKDFKVDETIFDRLKIYHSRYALVTLGDKGAFVSDFNKVVRVRCHPVKGKNHVGCGDAFLAGFVSAYLRGKDLAGCSRASALCAKANLHASYTGAIKIDKTFV